MDIKQSFLTAVRGLQANKARAVQSLLGMIVGVAAVFIVFCLAQGLTNQIEMQVANYNSGVIWSNVFQRMDTFSRDTLTDEHWRQFVAENPDLIDAVSPMIYVFDFIDGVKYEDKLYRNSEISVLGVNEDFNKINEALRIAQGRFLQYMDIERQQNVCVVGSAVADIMGGGALDKTLRIAGEDFAVVGVLAEIALDAENLNGSVYIPSSCAQRICGADFRPETFGGIGAYVNTYFIKAASPERTMEAGNAINAMLHSRLHDTDAANVTALDWQQEQMLDGLSAIIIPMLIIVLIILFIGCVGVMNMMTAIVAERTPEIGLRKAFGATNQDIRRQFVLESAFVGVCGGLFGLIFGLPASYILCYFIHLPADVLGLPFIPFLLTLMVAVLLGIISGTYPANQAAKLEPVEALCYN